MFFLVSGHIKKNGNRWGTPVGPLWVVASSKTISSPPRWRNKWRKKWIITECNALTRATGRMNGRYDLLSFCCRRKRDQTDLGNLWNYWKIGNSWDVLDSYRILKQPNDFFNFCILVKEQAFVNTVPGKIFGLQLREMIVENNIQKVRDLYSSQQATSFIHYQQFILY